MRSMTQARTRGARAASRGKDARAAADESPPTRQLTFQEEEFVRAYVDSRGNGAFAARQARYSMSSARFVARDLLTRAHILEAIEIQKEEVKAIHGFNREQAINIIHGIATAKLSDFDAVFRDPGNQKSYADLGYKIHAIDSVKESQKDGSIEVKIASASERRAAVNDLWEKLGLGEESGGEDRGSFLDRFLGLSGRLRRGTPEGGSTGGEGSP